jgi:hypothetical protein
MNYFLTLIILGLCGGGYYEYTLLQQKSAADQQQLTDLGAQVATLKAQDTALESANAQLTKAAADLTKQVQDAQSALADIKRKAFQSPAESPVENPAVSAGATPPLAPSGNILGTIGTLDGKTFPNAQLLKVQADGIVISYSGGITQIAFGLMAPDLQKRFGLDSQQAIILTPDQVQAQEDKRKAAASQTAGN